MAKTYRLAVAQTDGPAVADTDGNIDIMAYVARKLDLNDQATYAVDFSETDGISGGQVRTALQLTADGAAVKFLLARKIRVERKAAEAVEPASAPETPAELGHEPDPAFA